ncbi:MAG: response regulator transcription factor [SAR324 cluster bacterium]|nr:response regulator transcription factor [SAR324 cluster bacterium]
MHEKSLLLIDDDEELGRLLTDYLGREGYRVHAATNGAQGLTQAGSGAHALVLLDIMLPDMDGFEVLRELRKGSALPVIMLTAKGDEVERIVGLELGADDYLPKPFNPRELLARIKAVLRRSAGTVSERPAEDATGQLRVGELTVDLDGYRVLLRGRELPLTTIEFALLRELVVSAGRVLSRETLLDRVRGREFEVFDRSIDVHVSNIRQKLGDDPKNPRFIKTVRSVGYTFIASADQA